MEVLDKEQQAQAEAALAPKRKRLEDGQQQRIFAEGRFRDLQKANHKSLFDYEKQEAEAVCAQSTAQLKASLLSEIDRKRDLFRRYRDLAADHAARAGEAEAAAAAEEAAAPAAKKGRGSKNPPPPPPPPALEPLTEAEATGDLAAAAALIARARAAPPDDDDEPAPGVAFRVDDELSVFGPGEQKEVVGRLAYADGAKLVLKLADGTTIQFALADVQCGALVVAVRGAAPAPDAPAGH